MKIYVDLIIFINFFFDFLLLMVVNIILKRNIKAYKAILGAGLGSFSILSLFIKMSSIELFLIKVLISIIMILITFGFKNIKYFFNNIIYLYLVSIVLGGFLYFINNSISYKNNGLVFYNNGFSINIILILILTPIILFFYIKQNRKLKSTFSNVYEVDITFLNGNTSHLSGFLDTGNNLYDPYKKRPIILINKTVLNKYKPRCILVPCYTVNKESMINCFRVKKIIINGKKVKDEVLVGISDNNFNLEGVDLLLHKKII